LRNLAGFFRRQVIQVLVRSIAGVDLVLDTIQAGHQQGSEGQVGVGSRIREARFDAACLRARYVRDTDGGIADARRIGVNDPRLNTRDQTLVGVGGRVCEGVQRIAVLDDTADEVQVRFGQTGIAFARKGVLAVLADGYMHVHTGTVDAV